MIILPITSKHFYLATEQDEHVVLRKPMARRLNVRVNLFNRFEQITCSEHTGDCRHFSDLIDVLEDAKSFIHTAEKYITDAGGSESVRCL